MVTCTVNSKRYESVLRNRVIPTFQLRTCVSSIIFKLDGVYPHIANLLKELLDIHFGKNRIMSYHFPKAWTPVSLGLNLFLVLIFWLLNYLQNNVFSGSIENVHKLKTCIAQHLHKLDTLRSVLEYDVSRLQLVAEIGKQHTKLLFNSHVSRLIKNEFIVVVFLWVLALG